MNRMAPMLLLGDSESDLRTPRRTRHETSRHRCLVGASATLTTTPTPTPLSLPRPQAPGLSPHPHRHPVRPQDRHGLDDLPAELGCGCGKTCRHYLQLWHQAGVWRQRHAVLLAELNGADLIDWERALIDASFAKAPEGGEDTGPNPTDRGKSGSKHHVMTD